MDLNQLTQLAPGLCDAEDQNAAVIVNVDANDTDANGLPVNTSEVPEADMAEGAAAEAVAADASEVADDAAQAGDGLEQVEEALNDIIRERRPMTKTEAKLIDALANQATARLYRGATSEQRNTAFLGAGIESIEAGGVASVIAACEENSKGVVATIKAFIQKVIDFFKGIFNSIKKYLSGSAKLKGRAEEIKKRAAAAKKTSAEGKVSLGDAGILHFGNSASASIIGAGTDGLIALGSKILGAQGGAGVLASSISLLAKHWDDEKLDEAAKASLKTFGDSLRKEVGSGSRDSEVYIGGLQVGVIVNPDEYKVTTFAKQVEMKEKSDFEVLNKTQAEQAATKALTLIETVMKYQDGWKSRDAARKEVEANLQNLAKEAASGYAKGEKAKEEGGDGMVKRFQTKRRISQSVASNLMGVVTTEARVVAHSLKVASKLLEWADKSVKVLDKEEKTEKKTEDKK